MDVKTSPTQQCFFCRFISSFSSYPLRLQQVLLLSQSHSHSHSPPAQSWPGWDGQHAQIHPRHCCRPLLEDPEHMVHFDLELRLRCSFFFNISSKLKGTDSGVHSRNIHTNVTTALLKWTKRRSKRNFPISPLIVKVTSSWKSSWPRQPAWLSDSQGKLSDCPSLAFPSPTTRPYLAFQQTSSCRAAFRQCLTLGQWP